MNSLSGTSAFAKTAEHVRRAYAAAGTHLPGAYSGFRRIVVAKELTCGTVFAEHGRIYYPGSRIRHRTRATVMIKILAV